MNARIGTILRPLTPLLLLAAVLPALTGCTTFNSEWKKAAAWTPGPGEIAGAWDGEWRSDANGHHGRLRCILTRVDAESYRARYKANYWGILRFSYSVVMRRESEDPQGQSFRGSADLGKLAGGVYRYEAVIHPTNFVSTYTSRYDRGVFQLQRPSPQP